MAFSILRQCSFVLLMLILVFPQFLPTEAQATTDYFIFPGGNAKSIYCSKLQVHNGRIQCTTNSILMEFAQTDIHLVEAIHNGKSLKISPLNEKMMEKINDFTSDVPENSEKTETTDSTSGLSVQSFSNRAAAFQKKLSMETTSGKTATILLLLGIAGIVIGTLLYLTSAFRISILWGLGCIFIPFIPVIFLFAHWNSARKPFVISVLGLIAAVTALFFINGGSQVFTIKRDAVQNRFQCRGKVYCSEMTSCAEARFYLHNCPGIKIDGDHDNIPCERQWCN